MLEVTTNRLNKLCLPSLHGQILLVISSKRIPYSLILSFFVTYIISTYLGIEEIRLVKVAVSAFKKKRRLRDIKKNNKKAKKTTFESVVEKVMRIREEEKRKSAKRKKSTSSNTTISSTITTTTSSSMSNEGSNERPKRPESVAQR